MMDEVMSKLGRLITDTPAWVWAVMVLAVCVGYYHWGKPFLAFLAI